MHVHYVYQGLHDDGSDEVVSEKKASKKLPAAKSDKTVSMFVFFQCTCTCNSNL